MRLDRSKGARLPASLELVINQLAHLPVVSRRIFQASVCLGVWEDGRRMAGKVQGWKGKAEV